MRRRLALLALATTGLVVVSLLVPLGILVRRQAADRAQLDAERTAQATASLVALSLALGAERDALGASLGSLPAGVVLAFPDGTSRGDARPGQGSLIDVAAGSTSSVAGAVEGGWEMALPVIGREGVLVVDVFVTEEELTEGVARAWWLLTLLGVLLVVVAVAVADWLGRRLVVPIRGLAGAARRLGQGDLTARVEPADPDELREVGESFNWLAGRLEELLAAEREAAADLSHRLRTPLTSLRLQADGLRHPDERAQILSQVDRLEGSIDRVIAAARSRPDRRPGRCDLAKVVGARCAFWSVLAEEQGRQMSCEVTTGEVWVSLSEEEVGEMVDALIGNVFSHTSPGTAFALTARSESFGALLEVADDGPGFGDVAVLGRGVSGRGSSGLGLDIVSRLAESGGGTLELDDRPGGGAVVRVWLRGVG